jgi:hypothetical protein
VHSLAKWAASHLSRAQQSAVGHFTRESGLWTYPIVNLLHIFGIASLFGSILIIDLTESLSGVARAGRSIAYW